MKPTDEQTRELAKSLAYLVEQHGWRSFIRVLGQVCLSKAERQACWHSPSRTSPSPPSLK